MYYEHTRWQRDRNHQSTLRKFSISTKTTSLSFWCSTPELDSLYIIFFQDSVASCFPCPGHYQNLLLSWSLPSAALLGKGGTFCIVLAHFRVNTHMLPASFTCPFRELISFTSQYLTPLPFASVLVICLPQLNDSRDICWGGQIPRTFLPGTK